MVGYIRDKNGKVTHLPPLFSYRAEHGTGTPCDAFEISCRYVPKLEKALKNACFFTGVYKGAVVFAGVVDEYEVEMGLSGLTLSVSGRGMAARLLDNEAEAVIYGYCAPETVIRSYVSPFGIAVAEPEVKKTCSGFTVESGESCWSAVYRYFRFVCGIKPRFSRDGTLLLREAPGAKRSFDGENTVRAVRNESRYGIVSEVFVRDANGRRVKTVRNGEFIERGGSARRVLTLPRKPGFDYERYTGEYIIECSEEEKETWTLTAPEPFAAFPGDTAQVRLPEIGAVGMFRVISTESYESASGRGTEIRIIRGGDK